MLRCIFSNQRPLPAGGLRPSADQADGAAQTKEPLTPALSHRERGNCRQRRKLDGEPAFGGKLLAMCIQSGVEPLQSKRGPPAGTRACAPETGALPEE